MVIFSDQSHLLPTAAASFSDLSWRCTPPAPAVSRMYGKQFTPSDGVHQSAHVSCTDCPGPSDITLKIGRAAVAQGEYYSHPLR